MELNFLNETYTEGFNHLTLDILSVISIIAAILVIVSKNPVISVLFLIGLFISISLYLISIGATFIGISYLLVYVGAVSILFLFILMLINIRISELLSETRNSIPLVLIVSLSFSTILPTIIYPTNFTGYYFNTMFTDFKSVYYTLYSNWDNSLLESTHITSIGNILYTSHSIWLLITSIILLLAMVGAIIITIKSKNSNINNIKENNYIISTLDNN